MPCIERTVKCTDRHGSIERYVPQGTALGGTAWRVFTDDSAYAAPVAGARATDGARRADTGLPGGRDRRLVTSMTSGREPRSRAGRR